MKEKKEVMKNKLEEKKPGIKNSEFSEKVDFLEVGSTLFINPEEDNGIEDTENIKVEEIIQQIEQYPADVVSEETKRELQRAVKSADEKIKKTDGGKTAEKQQKRKEMEENLQNGIDRNVGSRQIEVNEKEPLSDKNKER